MLNGQHGHHRAVTRATIEAFDKSNDPEIFPDDNFGPWKISQIFLPAWSGGGGSYDDEEDPPKATHLFMLVILIIYLVEHIIKLVSGLAHIMQLKILES